MNPEDCPRSDQLADYLRGAISPEEIDPLADHIEVCSVCQSRIDALEGVSDSLLSDLPHMSACTAETTDPELERLLDRARALLPGKADFIATGRHAVPDREPSAMPTRIGDYEVLDKLGAGAFGSVYLARDPLLGRQVAIKVLRNAHRADPSVKARFLQELKALGQLRSHPHVVQAFQASEEGGALYLVMEYDAGTDLGQLTRVRGPLAVADACEVLRQAALGLQHVDDNGLVHRDLKPANLLLTVPGRIKILDLGLARLVEEQDLDERQTSVGQIMGTFDYMAPEQARDARQADIRADIYSLGCVLYRLLAGQVPFPVSHKLAKMEAHRSQEPSPLVQFRTDVPHDLQAIVTRMMAKDPAVRYRKPREVAAALAPFCKDADLQALLRPPEVSRKPVDATPETSRARLRPWPLLLLACLFLAGVGFLAGRVFSPLGPDAEEGPPGPIVALVGHKGPGQSLVIAPDSRHAASDDGTSLFYWDLDRHTLIASWRHGTSAMASSNLAMSPDGREVLVALNDSPVRSRLLRYGLPEGVMHGNPVGLQTATLAVSVSHDARRLLTTDTTGRVSVRDALNNEGLTDFQLDRPVRSASFAPDDSQIVCGCDNGQVSLRDRDGRMSRVFLGHSVSDRAFIIAVAISSDGSRVCSASLGDQTIRVWEARTGAPILSIPLNKASDMTCAAFDPAGRMALTGHQDGSVAAWRLEGGTPFLVRYQQHAGSVASVALGGGRALSAGSKDDRIWLYRLPGIAPLNDPR